MKLALLSFTTAAAMTMAGAVCAAPISTTPNMSSGDGAQIVLVAEGCGFGEHRGPYGGCRINHGPRGEIRAATTGLPRGCPPGMHRGFYGRCHY